MSYYDRTGISDKNQNSELYEKNQNFNNQSFFQTQNTKQRFQNEDSDFMNMFFQEIFGSSTYNQSMQESSLEIFLDLNLKESLLGFKKEIKYKRYKECTRCNYNFNFLRCSLCKGEKLIYDNENFILNVSKFCFNEKINISNKGNSVIVRGKIVLSPLIIHIRSESTFKSSTTTAHFDDKNNRLWHKEIINKEILFNDRSSIKLFNGNILLLKNVSKQILEEGKMRFLINNQNYTYILEFELK